MAATGRLRTTALMCAGMQGREPVNCKLFFSVAERLPLSITARSQGEGSPVYMAIYPKMPNLFIVIRPGSVIDESPMFVF